MTCTSDLRQSGPHRTGETAYASRSGLLPQIRSQIASHLSSADCRALALVNSTWRDAAETVIWKRVTFDTSDTNVDRSDAYEEKEGSLLENFNGETANRCYVHHRPQDRCCLRSQCILLALDSHLTRYSHIRSIDFRACAANANIVDGILRRTAAALISLKIAPLRNVPPEGDGSIEHRGHPAATVLLQPIFDTPDSLAQLKRLELDITTKELRGLPKCLSAAPNVEHLALRVSLTIGNGPDVVQEGLPQRELPRLRSLDYSGPLSVVPQLPSEIWKSPLLERLALCFDDISDVQNSHQCRALRAMGKLKHVRDFRLGFRSHTRQPDAIVDVNILRAILEGSLQNVRYLVMDHEWNRCAFLDTPNILVMRVNTPSHPARHISGCPISTPAPYQQSRSIDTWLIECIRHNPKLEYIMIHKDELYYLVLIKSYVPPDDTEEHFYHFRRYTIPDSMPDGVPGRDWNQSLYLSPTRLGLYSATNSTYYRGAGATDDQLVAIYQQMGQRIDWTRCGRRLPLPEKAWAILAGNQGQDGVEQ